MLSWQAKRKIIYLSFFFLFAGLIFTFVSFKYFYKKPTCFDGLRNQGEIGIDCGGPCPTLCSDERVPPTILWIRVFKVREGEYSVVSKMENRSLSFAGMLKYHLKLYDSQNVLVAERTGDFYIPPKRAIVFFESGLMSGDREAGRAVLEFTEDPRWFKTNDMEPNLKVVDSQYDFESSKPYFTAKVENKSLWPIEKILFNIIVYDKNGNAVGASRTFLDRIGAESQEDIIFTWPTPFVEKGTRFEILYWRQPK